MHNGKFDYEVIKMTCGIALKVYWDTMLGVRILDENEKSAKLKDQYRDKIDSSVEKYSIDHLFEDIEYAVVDPELFALYAATDEIHQLFVPGRSGEIRDVCLDSLGVITGIIILLIIFKIVGAGLVPAQQKEGSKSGK